MGGSFSWNLPGSMASYANVMAIKSLLVDNDVIEFKRQLFMAAKCTEAIILAEPRPSVILRN